MSFSQLTSSNADEFNVYHCVGSLQNYLEIRMITDVMMGEIFIIDFGNLTFAHLTKLTPVHIKKVFMAAEVSFLKSDFFKFFPLFLFVQVKLYKKRYTL